MPRLTFLAFIPARCSRRMSSAVVAAGLLIYAAALASGTETPSIVIKVDQVGYPLDGPKVAFVSAPGQTSATTFQIKRSNDRVSVFQGKLTPPQFDPNSGDQVQSADFSVLKQAGTYYLDVPGVGRSFDFSVKPNVFDRTYYLAMRAFYGQRCGTAVDLGPEFPGYAHPACHLHGEFHSSSGTSGQRDNIGGWHDAGDYGRYVVNSGITTGMLLWAWEIYGDKLKDISLNIPESGNGTPDILNEARWNLEWMLKMQDDDGGVWHKQTSTHFAAFIAPEADKLPSDVIGTGTAPFKSTCAGADLAAVAAIAGRVYRPFDAKFATRALEASRRAFAWTEKYPNVTFKNPPGVTTGDYGDGNCADERLWAAAELSRTTGEKGYNDFFVSHYEEFLSKLDSPPAEGWNSLGAMALWTYALSPRQGKDAGAVKAISDRTLASANKVVARTRANPYLISMQTRDYIWGSNSVAAGYGIYLLIADIFHPDVDFVNAARDNLHYLLGRNTFSLSWVTQVGENPFQHPHHRPSAALKDKAPWPGMLSGGPNAGRGDVVLKALPKDLPPARVYVDQTTSYAGNEIAINWQAALVFLLAGELR